MRLRWLIVALVFLATPASASAAEIHGKVTGVLGKDVRLALEGDLLPQAGDEVTIRFQIPGGPMVVVGTWRVSSIEADSVLATLVDATGSPAIDQHATIVSMNPVPRRLVSKDTIRVSCQGEVHETIYQHQIVDGHPIDIYFYVATDVGLDAAGNPSYNRFVREPAENVAGVPTWWHCRWVRQNGEWRYLQEKTGATEVSVLRVPVTASVYEGSVWKSTSTETSGDRKGQSFDAEFRMTTSNGITRMTSSTTYAEGSFSGDRFVFSTFKSDGTGPVGEGFCVFAGTVFSGGWTSTNGRAGVWQGRRAP
jgi:hypothetical protein